MTLARSLKVHLRVVTIHGTTLRVVRLRPQTTVRFSTNYFHDTWHILGSAHGAQILGQLMWGLSFQRHAGTLLLLDGVHLLPTPFEADPADPIVIVPAGLTTIDDDRLRALAVRLRRAPTLPTTIRWHCFGMRAALDAERDRAWSCLDENRHLYTRERMSRRAGFVCYTAPAPILRRHALGIHHMHKHDAGYFPLAETRTRRYGYDGEFQVIPDFEDKISAAVVARREVIGDRDTPVADDHERSAIYTHQERALVRLRGSRKPSAKP